MCRSRAPFRHGVHLPLTDCHWHGTVDLSSQPATGGAADFPRQLVAPPASDAKLRGLRAGSATSNPAASRGHRGRSSPPPC
jgi:hypothetical protein